MAVRKHFLADETELGQVIAQCLQFDGGLAFVRIGDAAGQQIGVIGEDLDALATSRDGDVKLFAVDGGERAGRSDEQDRIDCFSLRRMRRDGVAVGERVESGQERAAIRQGDAAVLDLPDLDALTVDEAGRVGLEQEPVASGDFQLAGFAHIKGRGGTGRDEIYFRAIGTAHTQAILDHGDYFHGLAPVKLFGLTDEAQALAGFKLAGVFLLGFRPGERIEDGDGFLVLANHALRLERVAHLLGHGLDLRPGGRD